LTELASEPGSLKRAEPLFRTLGAATAVGGVLGFLIGGVAARLAMRLLFLTSDPSVRGLVSDDGFVIGQVTNDTLNLLLSGTAFGVFGSFVYLAIRPFLLGPRWVRIATCALWPAAVMGSLIVGPDGVDFTVLSPVALAIVLFVAIPGLFGALCAPAIDWALRSGGWARNAPLRFVLAPLAVFLAPPLFLVVGLPTLGILGAGWALNRFARSRRLLGHPAALWFGRTAWTAVFAFGVLLLTEDLLALL
jgi:hypothetical protein